MSRLKTYGIVAAVLFVSIWIFQNSTFRDLVSSYVENGEILTLEARYSPEQIMHYYQDELLGEQKQRAFRAAELQFYPYILMNVKYPLADNTTREGVILWSMIDGEMVINTDSWEKTHGFEDALNGNATPSDFKLMNSLAKNKGSLSLRQLQKVLGLEEEPLKALIESAREKHLVIQRGHEIRLHFQNPRILVSPHTEMNEWIVTKPYSEAKRLARRYTRNQIEKTAHAAFGTDFSIRNVREVFLPVYAMETVNPDGSVLKTYWNALNGRRISL